VQHRSLFLRVHLCPRAQRRSVRSHSASHTPSPLQELFNATSLLALYASAVGINTVFTIEDLTTFLRAAHISAPLKRTLQGALGRARRNGLLGISEGRPEAAESQQLPASGRPLQRYKVLKVDQHSLGRQLLEAARLAYVKSEEARGAEALTRAIHPHDPAPASADVISDED